MQIMRDPILADVWLEISNNGSLDTTCSATALRCDCQIRVRRLVFVTPEMSEAGRRKHGWSAVRITGGQTEYDRMSA